MQTIIEIIKTVADLPPQAITAVIVLGGFGLAAYAIYAVLSMAKPKDRP